VGVTGVVTHGITTGTDDATEPRLRARDVIISETAVPDRFTQYPETGAGRFLGLLTDEAPELSDADTAGNGYWDGEEQENPHWVLASMAMVADETLPRATVEAVAEQAEDEFVADYDTETSQTIGFEQSHTRSDRAVEWQVDMVHTPVFGDPANNGDPLFTDLLRLQFFDNVLLGTVVFGPRTEPPELTALLEQFATQQHEHYRAHGATP
jgi:hypothetical protein